MDNVSQVDGYSLIDSQIKTNFGLLFVALKDYEERQSPALSADAVIADGHKKFYPIQGGLVVPVNPPAIPGLGVTAGFQMWIEQKGAGTYGQLYEVVQKILAKAKTRPELAGVNTTIRANGQQTAGRTWTGRRPRSWACRCRTSTTPSRPCSGPSM